jgi:TrpR family transcriptional regulator, trp operon repressor
MMKSESDVVSKNLDEFINLLLKTRGKEEMYDLLRGILTAKELIEIPNRLQIVKMLKRGIPHHDIAGKLHVGVVTVTRGSREIKQGRFQNV